MRTRVGRGLAAAGLVLTLALGAFAGPAWAQDTGGENKPDVPVQHIIPRPNSGEKPEDAGDRGGALQLGLLALVVVVLTGGTLHVVRQSRRARQLQEH